MSESKGMAFILKLLAWFVFWRKLRPHIAANRAAREDYKELPVGFGESRGIVNARRLGLSKHKHRADPAKKRARKAQRVARRITRRAA
jgi:hypothetical protein